MKSLLAELPNPIASVFARMGIAEDEIAAAKKRWPKNAKRIHTAFKWCCPSELLRDKTDELYKVHVQEIIERVASGKDPVPLTRAEVLAALSNASLAAPLGSRSEALMTELFNELGLGSVEPAREPWKGSNAELFAEMRCTTRLPNPRRDIDDRL